MNKQNRLIKKREKMIIKKMNKVRKLNVVKAAVAMRKLVAYINSQSQILQISAILKYKNGSFCFKYDGHKSIEKNFNPSGVWITGPTSKCSGIHTNGIVLADKNKMDRTINYIHDKTQAFDPSYALIYARSVSA